MSCAASEPAIDAGRLWSDIMALAEITEPDRPWTRRSFTPRFDEGREWLRRRMEADGLSVRIDAAGNMIGRREGSEPGAKAILIGSHTDTVPSGGRFDGVAGVVVGMEIARALDSAGHVLRHPLEVVDFLAEEPSEFGLSCIGSRGMAGALDAHMLAATRPDGLRLDDAIRAVGGAPEQLGAPLRDDIAAYFELHIEQATQLERAALSVGVVTGIAAVVRIAIRFEGVAAHAGATPMNQRADALAPAAECVGVVRRLAEETVQGSNAHFVATVGILDVHPNAANIVPGSARLAVDIRAGEPGDADRFIARLDEESAKACAAHGVTRAGFDLISRSDPALCDEGLRGRLEDAACAAGYDTLSLGSGAGHDAMFVARLAPMAMLFTPCLGGRSHCPEEWAEARDIGAGATTMLGAIRALDAG
ncbi:Zn-dependent hydrolase [Pikeienuella piscinae]|uniref:Zn-dependent hydrolase n=1 Tax=Pikeienuella piscinae TaxID=2748098 RepID=A0A7M3T693_9RHOB|nr:Zn-dependent hydrolase [Pikeienuella piscinae]QIE57524.1 Zn-dependent hydrolase [Pikeienuella piscinae]